MRVLAVLFRLLGIAGLILLSGLIWLKFDTVSNQQTAFLSEVIDDAYIVLQSEKEAQWKDVSEKKRAFNDVFESNQPLPEGTENPLSLALEELSSSEDKIYRNQEYSDTLADKSKEYGPGSLYWDAESKIWRISDGYKLESTIGFGDPFLDEMKYPFADTKNEDGTITKGVSRQQRLRTVIGMFYKDRHDRYKEVSNLREMILARDEELRKFQNLLAVEKAGKEKAEDELADAEIRIEGLNQDLEKITGEKVAFEEAVTEEKRVLNDQISELNNNVNNLKETHNAEIIALADEHKRTLEAKQKEITKADADGYKRGIEEMLAKQQGGEVADAGVSEEVNPFMIKKNDSLPPAINDLDMFSVSQKKQISELGAPSTISRVDSESGMMLLPFGVERGVSQGTVFTVWKDKREAARIRVQSSRDGFLLAYILPRFGEPQNLRPGDSIYIIPEEEQNL
jgi:hypothetical protein